jgi:ATP-dependent helicase/nuclease subunit B
LENYLKKWEIVLLDKSLINSLSKGNLCLTPNRRLAAYLQNNLINIIKKDEKKLVWQAFLILPFQSWLKETWDSWSFFFQEKKPFLLNSTQSQLIFEKIIQENPTQGQLLEARSSAPIILKAWKLYQEWGLKLSEPYTQETKAFINWQDIYQKTCNKNNWLDYSNCVKQVIQAIKKNQVSNLPKEVFFIGFDEWTPFLEQTYQALKDIGVKVKKEKLVLKTAKIIRTQCLNKEAEYIQAAIWAKNQLKEKSNNNPDSIAIIVPELSTERKKITTALESVLALNQYNISAPVPIKNYTSIQTGLVILELFKTKSIELETICYLLKSAYIEGDQQESLSRAMLETYLRKSSQLKWRIDELLTIIKNYSETNPENLCKKFENGINNSVILSQDINFYSEKNCSDWVGIFKKTLRNFGWPGCAILSETDRQLVTQWHVLLETYLSLEQFIGKHDYLTALKQIGMLAFSMPFLPECKQAPIQVLGMLEAAGIPFKSAWVVGLNQNSWPTPPNPNPFLPISVQRLLPRGSSERELIVAQRLTNTLCESIQFNLVFSSAKFEGDYPANPSALIMPFQLENQSEHLLSDLDAKNTKNKLTKQFFSELSVPLSIKHQNKSYGSRLLTLQSACSFWAFSEIRLRAISPNTFTEVFTPWERGEILHEALSKLSAVSSLTEIEKTTRQTLNKWVKKRGNNLLKTYIALETRRLVEKLKTWFEYEKEYINSQQTFVEQSKKIQLGKLQFSIRLDRVDRLKNGTWLLIDYKTGRCSPANWEGTHPDAPQLPLYCLALEGKTVGALFANITPEKIQFKGLLESDMVIPGVKKISDFTEKIAHWKSNLNQLTHEFIQGNVKISPKYQENTCRLCRLKNLCRVTST